MKRILPILFLIITLLLTACGRWYEQRIAGVWTGAGDFTLDGVDAPFTHNVAVGVEYRITGNTLTIGRKSDSSQFIKLSADKYNFGGNHDSD